MDQLKKSIKEHEMVVPVIANSSPVRKNIIIGGEMRWRACKALGHKTIPVTYLDIKDLVTEKSLCIRLNKVGGIWNEELLKSFDDSILLNTGFKPEELQNIYADMLDTVDDNFDTEKELAKIIKPQSKVGDLYQLGPHRLLCGDSTDLKVVQRVVGGEKMHLTYNDPIYNINYSYKNGLGGTKNYGGSAKDDRTDADYETLLKKTMGNALAVSHKDAHFFYYSDQKYTFLVQKLYGDLSIAYKRTCIWLKGVPNPTPQIAFSKIYEPVTYGVTGKPYLNKSYTGFHEILNKEITSGHKVIEEFYDMIDVWAVKRIAGNLYEHPTEKPVTLHDKPIKRCTKVGDNILSLFGGSGGEMISAHQLKRNMFMVELDPVFVDLIIRRYEKFTGDKAVKIN
jgi:DNA modification methylase